MGTPRQPIDNCPHEFEYDEVAEEDYCIYCGWVPDKDEDGWQDPTTINQ